MPLRPTTEAARLLVLVETDDRVVCVCGHEQAAHEHYRRGTDCALCDCPRFRRRR